MYLDTHVNETLMSDISVLLKMCVNMCLCVCVFLYIQTNAVSQFHVLLPPSEE